MSDIVEWLMRLPGHYFVKLFDHGDDLIVSTQTCGRKRSRTVLKRSEEMENAVISFVEKGLENSRWQGLFYVMGVGELPDFVPLYRGITRKAGGKQAVCLIPITRQDWQNQSIFTWHLGMRTVWVQ